jgi:hypothetical protein
LVGELRKLSIFNKDINVNRLLTLKAGLLVQQIFIDGFQQPYQVLIPFLTLGCLRLAKRPLDEELESWRDPLYDIDLESIVLDVLADTVNVLSATGSMPRPTAGN